MWAEEWKNRRPISQRRKVNPRTDPAAGGPGYGARLRMNKSV